MITRQMDGSAGDANYGVIGTDYSRYRRPEPAIEALIHSALGDARRVLNVGAGAGSYEPVDRLVVAVEPSASMRAQRPAHLPVAIDAVAEALPFAGDSFDGAMATFTVHQWRDLAAGLRQMRRVTRGAIVILSCDPDEVRQFCLNDYAPEVLATEAQRYPTLPSITAALGGRCKILPVPIPLLCRDGFNEAYYGRPECLLDDGARLACSAWSLVAPATRAESIAQLRRDLDAGIWDRRWGHLRQQPCFEGSLRLIISLP